MARMYQKTGKWDLYQQSTRKEEKMNARTTEE